MTAGSKKHLQEDAAGAAALAHSIDAVIDALKALRLQILAHGLATIDAAQKLPRKLPQPEPPPAPALRDPRPREICGCTHGIEHHPNSGPCTYGHGTAFGGCPCPGWHPFGKRGTKAKPSAKRERTERFLPSADDSHRKPLVPHSSSMETKLLQALAQANAPMHRQKLALWTGYSPTSGSYGQAIADLRSDGHIEGPSNGIVITEAGRAAAGSVEPLPVGKQLLQWWLSKLSKKSKGDSDVLLVLAHGNVMSRDAIAAAAGRSPTSGSFGQTLADLRRLGLISGPSSAIEIASELLE